MSTAALTPSRPHSRIFGTVMLVVAILAALGLAIAALVVSLNDSDAASVPASAAVVAPASQSSLRATVDRIDSASQSGVESAKNGVARSNQSTLSAAGSFGSPSQSSVDSATDRAAVTPPSRSWQSSLNATIERTPAHQAEHCPLNSHC